MPVPVHILCGFLGAGKTTAIRAQLEARAGERIAVIVNDFGEASLDGASLSEAEPFRITNIPGGCVCCTAPEGFVDALGAILDTDPERLLIEPTGLARPQDLVDTIRRSPHRERVALGPLLVLLDPARLARLRQQQPGVVEQQLEAADVLVANRIDLCGAEELARFDAWAQKLWPAPLAIVKTSHGRIAPELFDWPEGEGARLPRAVDQAGDPHRHSTEGFAARSWKWPPAVVFARERLARALERVAKGDARPPLERFKGIFRTREGVLRLELAGGSLHEAPSSHRRDSRADAIARSEEAGVLDALAGWLAEAVLTPAELEARSHQIEISLPDGRSQVVDRDELAALQDGIEDVSSLFPKRAGSAARVARLWQQLGLGGDGVAVVCAADGFASEPVPVSALLEGVVLHSFGGEPLAEREGGPFRLLIPEGVEGAPSSCANVKGVVRIVLRESR